MFVFMLMVGLANLFWGAMFRILESHYPDSALGRVIGFAH